MAIYFAKLKPDFLCKAAKHPMYLKMPSTPPAYYGEGPELNAIKYVIW